MKRSVLRRKTTLSRKKTLRKKSPKNINAELDQMVRQIILLRDGFKCVWCGREKVGRDQRKVVLQAAHVLPKGAYPALRHELKNVITLCWHCHMIRWHRNPADAWAWFVKQYGDAYVMDLRLMADTRSKVDKAALKLYLQSMLPKK